MSNFNQKSFNGGMNLLFDDTRLSDNQYTVGFNVRSRNDVLDLVLQSQVDSAAPIGIKQGLLTFGNYIILFVKGRAYYRYYLSTGWTQITGFNMSPDAPRYWTCAVPVATTNYGRIGIQPDGAAAGIVDPYLGITRSSSIVASANGNLPGLLVQDNQNQPQFIYLDGTGTPIARTTQTYAQWEFTIDPDTLVVALDNREYVPVGNSMVYIDGVLYIASKDYSYIYRSVSGRPLDFVIIVDENGVKAGDATVTSTSVGTGGITCLKELPNNALFVSASGANFSVIKNTTPGAPTICGEYTFQRQYLFSSQCLGDRVIIDSLGDTKFIDLTGVRSFNAILQQQNEGRNSPFSKIIQSALNRIRPTDIDIVQDSLASAAIVFDNYELYGLKTIFGPAIAVYDTVNECWASFDIGQCPGTRVKQFAKIESTIQRLYAITEDNKLYTLYSGPDEDEAVVRTISVSRNAIANGQNVKENIPSSEVKLTAFRTIVNNVTQPGTITVVPFVNNRATKNAGLTKNIKFSEPVDEYVTNVDLPDIGTQLNNIIFPFTAAPQGWKCFCLVRWNEGSIVQYSMELNDITPQNPLSSQ